MKDLKFGGKSMKQVKEETLPEAKPTALLSFCLNDTFAKISDMIGFNVLHRDWFPMQPSAVEFLKRCFADKERAKREMDLEKRDVIEQYLTWILQKRIDIAIEWQRGPELFPLMELLTHAKIKIPIYLSLNWSPDMARKFRDYGFDGILKVPFAIDELRLLKERYTPKK